MKQIRDLTGLRFERWAVVAPVPRLDWSGTHAEWVCRCDCGAERKVSGQSLTLGRSRSCGCLRREVLSVARQGNKLGYKHGHATGLRSPEYAAWSKMKERCTNERCAEYFRYGGRGITVCDRWLHSFADFLADMGPRPTPTHSLDRIDNDGNYEPGNCRWATKSEQSSNRRPYKWSVPNPSKGKPRKR